MEQYCQRALDKDGFVVIGTEFQRAIGEVVEERMASKFGVISAKIVVIAPSTFEEADSQCRSICGEPAVRRTSYFYRFAAE